MTTKDLIQSLPFNEVRSDTFSAEVIQFCGVHLQKMLPEIGSRVLGVGDALTLDVVRRTLGQADVAQVEVFVFLSKLFLAGFGPSRLDSYDQLYLADLVRAVERHLELALKMGMIDSVSTDELALC